MTQRNCSIGTYLNQVPLFWSPGNSFIRKCYSKIWIKFSFNIISRSQIFSIKHFSSVLWIVLAVFWFSRFRLILFSQTGFCFIFYIIKVRFQFCSKLSQVGIADQNASFRLCKIMVINDPKLASHNFTKNNLDHKRLTRKQTLSLGCPTSQNLHRLGSDLGASSFSKLFDLRVRYRIDCQQP